MLVVVRRRLLLVSVAMAATGDDGGVVMVMVVDGDMLIEEIEMREIKRYMSGNDDNIERRLKGYDPLKVLSIRGSHNSRDSISLKGTLMSMGRVFKTRLQRRGVKQLGKIDIEFKITDEYTVKVNDDVMMWWSWDGGDDDGEVGLMMEVRRLEMVDEDPSEVLSIRGSHDSRDSISLKTAAVGGCGGVDGGCGLSRSVVVVRRWPSVERWCMAWCYGGCGGEAAGGGGGAWRRVDFSSLTENPHNRVALMKKITDMKVEFQRRITSIQDFLKIPRSPNLEKNSNVAAECMFVDKNTSNVAAECMSVDKNPSCGSDVKAGNKEYMCVDSSVKTSCATDINANNVDNDSMDFYHDPKVVEQNEFNQNVADKNLIHDFDQTVEWKMNDEVLEEPQLSGPNFIVEDHQQVSSKNCEVSLAGAEKIAVDALMKIINFDIPKERPMMLKFNGTDNQEKDEKQSQNDKTGLGMEKIVKDKAKSKPESQSSQKVNRKVNWSKSKSTPGPKSKKYKFRG
ncbi:hypothetical protein Tco_0792257 [Tanacetum coccineum]